MFRELAGVRTYCESAGDGPPVVLLHGWGGRAASLRPLFDGLRPGFAVHALDLPGFGESDLPPVPWAVADYARLVAAYLDAADLPRASLIGHSFGGRIAICLAAERPERVDRLVLANSAGLRPDPSLRQAVTAAVVRGGGFLLAAPGLGRLRDCAAELARARLGSDDYRNAGPLRETFVRVVAEDLRPLLPRIQAPTLLLWGDQDHDVPLAQARTMEREIPDAGLVVMAGAGHFSYLDRPADFLRIVRTFLAGPGPAAPAEPSTPTRRAAGP